MGLLETLQKFDEDLVNWLIHVTPAADGDAAKMRSLFAVHGELEDTINDLVAYQLKLAVATLPDEVARLKTATAALKAAEGRIERIQDVVGAAGTALEIAGKVLAFAAAA